METRKPNIEFHGTMSESDQACAVSHRIREPAVLDMDTDVFHPSLHAQSYGWRLVLARSKFQKLLLKMFF